MYIYRAQECSRFVTKKSVYKQHLLQQHDFPFNFYKSVANNNSKEQALLMNQEREKT